MKLIRNLFLIGLVQSLAAVSVLSADFIRINEFMALNSDGLEDEDGDEEDWIELHNYGSNAVNLAGWYLTDTTNNLQA